MNREMAQNALGTLAVELGFTVDFTVYEDDDT